MWAVEVIGGAPAPMACRSVRSLRAQSSRLSAACVAHEGWSEARRTLGSLRYMLETGLIRCGVPQRIASGFIGHEVAGFDGKAGDRCAASRVDALWTDAPRSSPGGDADAARAGASAGGTDAGARSNPDSCRRAGRHRTSRAGPRACVHDGRGGQGKPRCVGTRWPGRGEQGVQHGHHTARQPARVAFAWLASWVT